MRVVQRTTLTLVVVGGIAWAGLAAIALQLAEGAAVGFDLELLLQAGRDVAAGRSPYDPAMLAGTAPQSTSLFYSYPPPVAQALAPFAGVPSTVMLLGWWAGAAAGLVVVAEALRRRLAPSRSAGQLALAVLALAPLVLPLTVGLLFGNLDAWFPFLYGAMVLAAVAPSRATAIGGGIALALAALKLHPASLGLWFLVRGLRGDRHALWATASAVAAGALVIVASVVVGGVGLWSDYALVVQAGSGADIVDPRNAGPAAVATSLLGGDEALARAIHLGVGLAAVAITILAAWRRRDPLESFAWAAAASLATLPVTWYHYPSALMPIALAALLRAPVERRDRVRVLVLAAGVTAAVALLALPLLWVAVALVIAAAVASKVPPAAVPTRGRAP